MFDFLKRKSPNREAVSNVPSNKSKSQLKREAIQKASKPVKREKSKSLFTEFLKTVTIKEKEVFSAKPVKAMFAFRKWIEAKTDEELATLLTK